jgi:hypothetical protein
MSLQNSFAKIRAKIIVQNDRLEKAELCPPFSLLSSFTSAFCSAARMVHASPQSSPSHISHRVAAGPL